MPKIQNRNYRVSLEDSGAGICEKIEYTGGGKALRLFDVRYHVKYWFGAKGEPKILRFAQFKACRNSIILYGDIPELGCFSVGYSLDGAGGGVMISGKFDCVAAEPVELGFFFLGLEPPSNADSLRLVAGCYSGYTLGSDTFLFEFDYDEKAGFRQMAFAVDQKAVPQNTCRTSYQYLTLSYPPSYMDGAASIVKGRSITGSIHVRRVKEHIWDPLLKKKELEKRGALAFAPLKPRFSYKRYVDNWEKYTKDPVLWIDFGGGQGMFHVGIYGMLTKWQYGGPYGWSINGKIVRYKDVHDIVYGRLMAKNIRLDGCQKNLRQCEIAWGNGGNSMIAYGMYRHGKPWARRFGDGIINAILGLEGRGFMIPAGPLAGAWIGAYEALSRKFTDHYGGQQVFLPDQGYVNYFLALCWIEGLNRDPRIPEAVRRNCEGFLLPLLKRHGGRIPNALQPDGTPGYSREGVPYDFPNAPAIALTASSFAMLYQMTGEKRYLHVCDWLLEEHLAPLIARHEFGFLEYDHHGHDSSGACVMLMAFADYLEMGGGTLKTLVRRLQEKVFYYLMSFRHEHDYFLCKHSKNVMGWGGIAKNKYGFIHGYSPASLQGTYCLHIRWEYPYALLRTAQTSNIKIAGSALKNHLNYLTYQQFVNKNLEKGFGGVTEHTALSTYSQDTTHVVHSMPLAMILMHSDQR